MGSRRVVLIRAVNVGGAKLPMAELRALAEDLGATDVSTYIASGNLVCTPNGDGFDRALEKAIETRFGYFREVISRTPAQLRAALAAHPFDVVNDRHSYIHFLVGRPAAEAVAAFEDRVAAAGSGDEAKVVGTELHLRYRDGAGRSDLDAGTIARALGVQGTGRNLNTVRNLIALSGD